MTPKEVKSSEMWLLVRTHRKVSDFPQRILTSEPTCEVTLIFRLRALL